MKTNKESKQVLTDDKIETIFEQRRHALSVSKNRLIGRAIEKAVLKEVENKFNSMQSELRTGKYTGLQDGKWWLFDSAGEGLRCADNLFELIFDLDQPPKT